MIGFIAMNKTKTGREMELSGRCRVDGAAWVVMLISMVVLLCAGLAGGTTDGGMGEKRQAIGEVRDEHTIGASAKYKIINPGCCACCQEKNGCKGKRVKVNMQIGGTNRCMKMETCEHCKAAKSGVCPTTVVVTTGGRFRMRAK